MSSGRQLVGCARARAWPKRLVCHTQGVPGTSGHSAQAGVHNRRSGTTPATRAPFFALLTILLAGVRLQPCLSSDFMVPACLRDGC